MVGVFSCDDDDVCGGELYVISFVVGVGEVVRFCLIVDVF